MHRDDEHEQRRADERARDRRDEQEHRRHAGDQETSLAGACSRSPSPRGSIVNANGTTNAGAVYFHDSIVVRSGLPPVTAAAANGDSAVGGLTSESTA